MRTLALVSTLPLLAGALSAQCLNTAGGVNAGLVATGFYPANDEGRSPPIDMLFGAAGFPMAGAVGTLTHVVVGSNGELYLTSGGAAVDPIDYGGFSVDDLRGYVAGASPRVFAFSTDLEGIAAGYAVTVDTTVAGRCKVNWIDVEEYFSGGPQFSFSASLFDTGVIELSYGNMPASAFGIAGVSIGNLVGTGLETPVDLTAGPNSGTLGLIFQEMNGIDVPTFSDRTVTLIPNGTGGYQAIVTCQPANHKEYGTGCYTQAESFYQQFADAAAASAALQGNGLLLTPSATGYTANWLPGVAASLYVTPTGGATSLPVSDDGSVTVTPPSTPFPTPSGPATDFTVSHNGIVTMGLVSNNDFDFSPSGAELASSTGLAFYTWSDWRDNNATPLPSGTIKTEQIGTVYYVTWENVDHWMGTQTNNPSTFQFQFDLTTGIVTIVWVQIDTDTTSTFGSGLVAGVTLAGAGADPGSIDLATALPVTIGNVLPMSLSAAPAPVINPSTVVTYTASNIPEFVPTSGIYLSTMFLSVNPNPGGFDLFGILTNTPGCNAWILTLDLDLGGQLTFAPTATWNFTFNNVFFAPGNQIAAQAVALFDSNFPLFNGENGGFVMSNGVLSTTEVN